jgi:putative transposase
MPRMARVKTNTSIFHIVCRSISEVDLFKTNDDKLKYISLIKKAQTVYNFRVYGYCLMDNHLHLIIDVNGADISDIMHSINFSYAQYFNRFHKRHGHLFQDRFKSKIIQNDRYLFSASAYIHNNVIDIKQYKYCPEKYEFSSLSVYLGLKKDPYELVSSSFVLGLFGRDPKAARQSYKKFVYQFNNAKFKEEIEFNNEPTDYKSQRTILAREYREADIIKYIAEKTNIKPIKFHTKYCREAVEAKALLVLFLRGMCNFKCGDICRILGNVTQAWVSKLCSIGVNLIDGNEVYRNIVEEFIKWPELGIN